MLDAFWYGSDLKMSCTTCYSNRLLFSHKADIVSFDVFDTVLIRNLISPDHVHWMVGMMLANAGLIAQHHDAWRDLRIKAEEQARICSRLEEISIYEIYDHLGQMLNLDDTVKHKAIELEVIAERSSLFPIVEICEAVFVLLQSKRVVFISDMYLDSACLKSFLYSCGLGEAIVFSSSDLRLTKRTATIYPHVKQKLNCPGKEIIHVGDNRYSDVRMARKSGFKAIHFNTSVPSRYETILWKNSNGHLLGSLVAGSARVARLSHTSSDRENSALWRISTGVAGPQLLAFVTWVLIEASLAGIKKLFFLARDGEILQKLADLVARTYNLETECHYMMASRQALYIPSLSKDPLIAVEEIVGAAKSRKTFRQILTELEFLENEIEAYAQVNSIAADLILSDDSFRAFALNNKKFLERLVKTIEIRSDAFNSYADNIGLFSNKLFGIVDLGWHGNLQTRLEKCISADYVKPVGYYFSLLSDHPSLAGRTKCFVERAVININLLETFCLATHSTVTGYFLREEQPNYILAASRHDGPKLWDVSEQQKGIMKFSESLFRNLQPCQYSLPELLLTLKPAADAAFDTFINNPDPDEALVYGSVEHAADQLHLQVFELAPRIRLKFILRFLMQSELEQRMGWRKGMISRTCPHWVYALFEIGIVLFSKLHKIIAKFT